MTKYRPHTGSLDYAMGLVVEVNSRAELVEHLRNSVLGWYPEDELPTLENIEIKPYAHDPRINWNTHLVTVKGSPWGYTDGPL